VGMTEHKVPVQSLIDHIKTAIDVDPWAKEMAEDLLKEHEAVKPKVIRMNDFGYPVHVCGKCGVLITESMRYCNECGKRIDWESR